MTEPAPWTLLYNRVKSSCPGAADALIRLEVTAVMVDFTQETNVWIENIPFTTAATVGDFDYDLVLDGGTANRLMLVYDPALPGPQHWYMNGISMIEPPVIHFVTQPELSKPLVARIAKACSTPQVTGTPPVPTGYPVIDPWIVDKYTDVLYYGALSYLQSEPSKVFTDPKQAAQNASLYRSGKTQAKVEVQRANIYGGQAWAFPQGWSTISRKGWA